MSNNCFDDGVMTDVEKEDVLRILNEIFDKPVLLPLPYGKKGPKGEERVGWNKTTYATTQRGWYKNDLEKAVKAGGNLGVILGPSSENLVPLDLDSDEEMERFFEWAPWAKESLISIGAKGCQVWFYMDGQYPNKRIVWKVGSDKKPIIEFRGAGQSVIWGKHPDTGGRYTTNGKKPLHVTYLDLKEYHGILCDWGEGSEDEDIWRPGQKDDYEWTKKYRGCDLKQLDLVGILRETGIKCREIESGEEGWDKYAFQCPWIGEHTTETGMRDAAIHIFEPRGRFWPAFTCFHSHCNKRGLKDLLSWLEQDRGLGPDVIRKHCEGVERDPIEISDYNYSLDLIEEPILPDPIIDGLLYPELKMLISSSAKIGKTWLGIDLGLSLAYGIPWLGFDTCQNRTLYINMEMPIRWFDRRVYDIRRAKQLIKPPKGSFKCANLRGSNALEKDLNALDEVWEKHGPFNVIIYDPIYKLLGELDENKANDVAKLLRRIDMVGRKRRVASVMIHHYAKGNPWEKRAGDRASGSGVFLRDPDTYMAVTELGEENSGTARVDCRLRCAPFVASFGIRWDNYQWKNDPTIEISKTKKKKDSEPKELNKQDLMIQILKDNPNGMTYTQWKNATVSKQITTEKYFEKIVGNLDPKRVQKVRGSYFTII